jgi:hypothetical protein
MLHLTLLTFLRRWDVQSLVLSARVRGIVESNECGPAASVIRSTWCGHIGTLIVSCQNVSSYVKREIDEMLRYSLLGGATTLASVNALRVRLTGDTRGVS